MVTFDGSPLEIEAIRLWRQGEDPEQISRATRISPGELVTLMRRYLEYRRARLWNHEECRNIRDSKIDQIDALIETYLREALAGNLKAAQFVLAAYATQARLEAGYYAFDEERLGSQRRNVPDVRKIEGTPSQQRQERLRQAQAEGIEVDPAALLAGALIQAAG